LHLHTFPPPPPPHLSPLPPPSWGQFFFLRGMRIITCGFHNLCALLIVKFGMQFTLWIVQTGMQFALQIVFQICIMECRIWNIILYYGLYNLKCNLHFILASKFTLWIIKFGI